MSKTSYRRRSVGFVLALAVLCFMYLFVQRMGIGGLFGRTVDSSSSLKVAKEESPTDGGGSSIGISPRLRFDWSDLPLSSPLAHYWHGHMRNCDVPHVDFQFKNRNGFGHELHMWTQALCNAAERGLRFRTRLPWSYRDSEACRLSSSSSSSAGGNGSRGGRDESAVQCYFPEAEPVCPDDGNRAPDPSDRRYFYPEKGGSRYVVLRKCPKLMRKLNASYSDVRASAIEYLFSRTSPVVIDEAERQLKILFGDDKNATSFSRLVTVHIRWGDKNREMKLLPIDQYVRAVQTLLREPPRGSDDNADPDPSSSHGSNVGIYLSTEDPKATNQFKVAAAKLNWTVFVDVYQQEFASVRDGGYNGNPRMAKKMQGRPGLVALGSLLVAMQANDFVLTTRSNWSRLMNELRKSVVDPRCGNCTRMVDLHAGEW